MRFHFGRPRWYKSWQADISVRGVLHRRTAGLGARSIAFHRLHFTSSQRGRSSFCPTTSICRRHNSICVNVKIWQSSKSGGSMYNDACSRCMSGLLRTDWRLIQIRRMLSAYAQYGSIKPRPQLMESMLPVSTSNRPTSWRASLKRLNFVPHVKNVCRNSFYHIRALRHIRRSINTECANEIACAIINTRLDYCNSFLVGTSQQNILALQRV